MRATLWRGTVAVVYVLLANCLLGVDVRAQAQASVAQSAPGAACTQAPVIRTTTRLVQVSVVVTDKKGASIPGLTKENFTVLDEKQAQQIVVFEGASAGPAAPPVKLPFNIFTNRYDALGQDPGSVNIVLFDALNTAPADILFAREQMMKFLKSMKLQDHVAIYALTNQLLILHDFTADSASLVAMVHNAETVGSSDQAASPNAFFESLSATDSVWAGLNFASSHSDAIFLRQQNADRVLVTCKALEAIADHVSGISGRKSLIWVSGGFPRFLFDPGHGEQYNLNEEMKRAMQALNHEGIAVYPVDAHGVQMDPGMSPRSTTGPEQTASLQNPFHTRQARFETFNFIADQTGGKAFYGMNDLAEAAWKAVNDGRDSYALGFYPDHGQWNGKFRSVKVQVNVPGAELRYRKGYLATAAKPNTEKITEEEIQKVALSPLEATEMRLVVSVRHVTPATTGRQLDFQVGADVGQLLLEHAAGQWKGGVDLLFLQRDANEKLLSAEQKHIAMDLPDAQHDSLLKSGAIFERHLGIAAEAVDVRVLLRDSSSGVVGTVTIPLKALSSERPESGKSE